VIFADILRLISHIIKSAEPIFAAIFAV